MLGHLECRVIELAHERLLTRTILPGAHSLGVGRRGGQPQRRCCRLRTPDAERQRREGTGGSMPEEFEGDLAGAVFWGADLSGARFRDVNLSGAKITHAWLVDVEIDALVERVVI